MSGLCGWVAGSGLAEPDAQLAAMAAQLLVPQGALSTEVAGRAALAAPSGQLVRDGDVLAGFTGDPCWHEPELAALAAARGRAHSLLMAWRQYGRDLLQHVGGRFSLAVLDGRSGQGIVATDRAGAHPIAFADLADVTAFASSVQAVRAFSGVNDDISPQALLTYLFYYVMPAPMTPYSGIAKLRAAEALFLGNGAPQAQLYRETRYLEETDRPLDALQTDLRGALRQAVDRVTEGLDTDRVGAFLSGGLDSSTVTALFAERAVRPVKTFTIGFDEPGYDETGYARVVAEAFGTDHHEYYVTPSDVADLIPRLAGAYDEPFGNHSAVPAYYCAKAAREAGVQTMLAGDGGDELFAGNERYLQLLRHDWYGRLPAVLRRGVIEPLSRLPGLGAIPLGRKMRGLIRFHNTPLPDRLYAFDFFAKEGVDEIFDSEALGQVDLENVLDLVRATYRAPQRGSQVQRLMYMDMNVTLADNDLRKVNRMTALAGVDVRYPMLDDGVVDFAATLPENILLPQGELRGFYKQAMQGILPTEVLTKSKHGFGLPFSRWVKTDPALKDLVDVALRNFKVRGLLRDTFLERVMHSHHQPQATIVDRFAWDIMMLELWMTQWQAPPPGRVEPEPK